MKPETLERYNSLSEHYKEFLSKKCPKLDEDEKFDDYVFYCWDCDRREKEQIEKTTGYISAQPVRTFKKNIVPWCLPVAEKILKQGVYLIAKDCCSLTRNIEEALLIEGNPLGIMDFHLISNGYEYEFISKDRAKSLLENNPPPRKAISKKVREEVYKKYNGHCAYCGCELELKDMQVDHYVSHMNNMGEDTIENYMPACEVCNRVKWASTIDGFRKSIKRCGEIHRARKTPIMADSDKIAFKYDLHECDKEIKFYFEKLERTK